MILDYAQQWPTHIASGYSALTLYRLPYLTDAAPVTFIGPTSKTRSPTPTTPGLKRRGADGIALTTVHHFGHTIYAAAPAYATIQAIQMLKSGEHSPAVITPEGLDPSKYGQCSWWIAFAGTSTFQHLRCAKQRTGAWRSDGSTRYSSFPASSPTRRAKPSCACCSTP